VNINNITAGLRIRIHFIRIWSQHFRLNTDPDPDPIRIQGFNDKKKKKLQLKRKLIFFWSKTNIYLSLGLPKERPSYRRSLQLSEEAIQHLKTWTYTKNFSTFVGHFCPPGSGSGFRIRIHWPDWIRIQSGSGSATLHYRGRYQLPVQALPGSVVNNSIGFHTDPDPAFYLNEDPDPGNLTNADPGSWSDFKVIKNRIFYNKKIQVL
jgi:hypothetical protein